MIDSATIVNYLRSNKGRFYSEYHLVKIGLFGSIARNDHQETSDIDILVEFEENTPELYEKKTSLKEELQLKFNLPVDICREKYIKPAFRNQIIAEAIYA